MNVLLLLTALMAANPSPPQDLRVLQGDVEAVQRLQDHGFLPEREAGSIRSDILGLASKVHGSPVNATQLDELTTGTGEKILRFFTLTRIITVIAGIILTVAVIAIGAHYLGPILAEIGPATYEVLAFGGAGGLIYLTSRLRPEYQLFTLIPGCLLLIGAFALVDHVHNIRRNNPDVYAFLCAVIWGWAAVHFQSGVVGFLAVGALLLAVGFNDVIDPIFGWMRSARNDDDPSPRVALAGLSVLGLDVIGQLTHNPIRGLEIFHGSAEWLGAFAFFFSMLWISSAYYDDYRERYGPRFWVSQMVYIAGILAALYLGTMFGLSNLLVVGGWFTGFYLLVKYCELPWKGIGWAWAALGIAGFLYLTVGFAQTHPQYFLPQ